VVAQEVWKIESAQMLMTIFEDFQTMKKCSRVMLTGWRQFNIWLVSYINFLQS
jgi:hypothetical protein